MLATPISPQRAFEKGDNPRKPGELPRDCPIPKPPFRLLVELPRLCARLSWPRLCELSRLPAVPTEGARDPIPSPGRKGANLLFGPAFCKMEADPLRARMLPGVVGRPSVLLGGRGGTPSPGLDPICPGLDPICGVPSVKPLVPEPAGVPDPSFPGTPGTPGILGPCPGTSARGSPAATADTLKPGGLRQLSDLSGPRRIPVTTEGSEADGLKPGLLKSKNWLCPGGGAGVFFSLFPAGVPGGGGLGYPPPAKLSASAKGTGSPGGKGTSFSPAFVCASRCDRRISLWIIGWAMMLEVLGLFV